MSVGSHQDSASAVSPTLYHMLMVAVRFESSVFLASTRTVQASVVCGIPDTIVANGVGLLIIHSDLFFFFIFFCNLFFEAVYC